MTKLRLKRTPAEEQKRAQRRAHKAARRKQDPRTSTRQKHTDPDDDVLSASSCKPDYDAMRAELEEMQFRDRLWGALEEDERLDGINARFSDYAHVPDRWARDHHDLANPQYMDDDEYAEWIREGMWKKKHAQEYAEQARRDAERAAQRAREKKIKAETAHLERLALERQESRRKERQRQREQEHRERYDQRWKALLDPQTRDPHRPLTFQDIPWPLFSTHSVSQKVSDSELPLSVEDITPEAVAAFLLPDSESINTVRNDELWRRNRDKLRETLLRFHPDKFEGRFMHRVIASDVESVKETVGQVARTLNILMNGRS